MVSNQFALPVSTVTRNDVSKLIREIELIDGFLTQASLREAGASSAQMPKTSNMLDEVTTLNKLNLLQKEDRNKLHEFLTNLRMQAPILHLSFNNEPSQFFQQKLVTWIRQQMHPSILLQIGLSPSIGAGCILRSTNKVFDFSLRQRFIDNKEMLLSRIKSNNTPTAIGEIPTQALPIAKIEITESEK